MKQILQLLALLIVIASVSADFSTLCSKGYYLKQTGRGSYCEKCPEPCSTCTDFGVCEICADGYQQGTAPDCFKCDPKCAKCTKNKDRTVTCNQCI